MAVLSHVFDVVCKECGTELDADFHRDDCLLAWPCETCLDELKDTIEELQHDLDVLEEEHQKTVAELKEAQEALEAAKEQIQELLVQSMLSS